MSRKFIFLDCDGVLNNSYTSTKTVTGWTFVEDYLIQHLKKIIDATGAEIILSSSWRWGYWSSGKDRLDYLELIEKLADFGIFIKDITPAFSSNDREAEILWWLEHQINYSTFVILDDDECYFSILYPNVVITDKSLGLTTKEVDKAIEILNREAE